MSEKSTNITSLLSDITQASIDFANKYQSNDIIDNKNDDEQKNEQISSNIFSKCHLNDHLCVKNQIKDCKAIQRIAQVLQFYDDTLNKFQHKNNEKNDPYQVKHILDDIDIIKKIQSQFGDHYTMQNILNDHVHIVLKHHEYLEEICNFIGIKCNLSKCNGIKRHHRDRTGKQLITNNIDDNHAKMIIIDIFD
eukprot:367007_1